MLKFVKNSFKALTEVALWLNLIACVIIGAILCKGLALAGDIRLDILLGGLIGAFVGMYLNIVLGGFIAVILNIDENLELLTKKSMGVDADSEKFDMSSNPVDFAKAEEESLMRKVREEEALMRAEMRAEKEELKREQAEFKRQSKNGL
jgi:hypothetical protein